ncbi:hypothetical protein MTO96_018431 [Rhipicephalus appendiculatus]
MFAGRQASGHEVIHQASPQRRSASGYYTNWPACLLDGSFRGAVTKRRTTVATGTEGPPFISRCVYTRTNELSGNVFKKQQEATNARGAIETNAAARARETGLAWIED